MDKTWYLVHQEFAPLSQNAGMYTHGFVEFVSREEMSANTLVSLARNIIQPRFTVIGAALYQDVAAGTARRWLAEISLAPKAVTDMTTFQADVETLGQQLEQAGILYRATKEWPWDWVSGTINDIGGIMQMVMMLMVMGLMMFMVVPLLSAG